MVVWWVLQCRQGPACDLRGRVMVESHFLGQTQSVDYFFADLLVVCGFGVEVDVVNAVVQFGRSSGCETFLHLSGGLAVQLFESAP